jgi:hypothetical protein
VINKTQKIQACFVPVEFTLKSKFQFLVLTFFVLLQTVIIAQQNYPLNREWGLTFDKSNAVIAQKISKDSSSNNTLLNYTCFKPFIVSPEHQVIDKSKSWGYRK